MAQYKTFLIAGPTASGKSDLALKLGAKHRGVIINTDSMQVYSNLRVLTARPTEADEVQVPHRLYGCVDENEPFSAGAWLRLVQEVLPELRRAFETLIFVGGTGLYFNALTQGLSEIPETPAELRQILRQELQEQGAAYLYAQLQSEDAAAAAMLKPTDGQRIVRALEVFRHTGRSLKQWHEIKSKPLVEIESDAVKAIVIVPDRAMLAAKIEKRFSSMVENGALSEVSRLTMRNLHPELPAMKAIGVRELSRHLNGEISLDQAITLASIASRQYAKRQRTWFAGQMDTKWARFSDTELALAQNFK